MNCKTLYVRKNTFTNIFMLRLVRFRHIENLILEPKSLEFQRTSNKLRLEFENVRFLFIWYAKYGFLTKTSAPGEYRRISVAYNKRKHWSTDFQRLQIGRFPCVFYQRTCPRNVRLRISEFFNKSNPPAGKMQRKTKKFYTVLILPHIYNIFRHLRNW